MPAHGVDEVLLGFTRALRAAGLPVTQDRNHGFLAAVALLGAGDPAHVRRAGHATLCASPEDLTRFDRVFEAWFDHRDPPRNPRPAEESPTPRFTDFPEDDRGGPGDAEGEAVAASASTAEVLRHRDVSGLDAAERRRLAAMFATLQPRAPRRRTARHHRARRGDVDAARTLRAMLRRMGEPGEVVHRRRSDKARRIVLLVDVSGSMSGYAEAHLRLAHRFVQGCGVGRVEAFTVGTRLTRITRALALRDPDRALAAAGDVVPDWSGGTRLGESLQQFLLRHGSRGTARGAVVVVLSDGWERGDTGLLHQQAAHLRRLAHRVVWVNPHRGKEGYAPVQSGIVAVLPYVDDLVAGHSLATFAEVMEVVGDA